MSATPQTAPDTQAEAGPQPDSQTSLGAEPNVGAPARSPWPASLQLIGSKGLGGAERWFQRFCDALAERGAPAAIGIRAGSGLDQAREQGLGVRLPCHRLPFRTVWDPFSRQAISRLVKRIEPAIVQTYMGRATRLTRLPRRPGSARPIHLTRLGGYYELSPYRHADAWIGNTRQLCDWMVQQGLPAERVFHIYNFVDPPPRLQDDPQHLRRALGLSPDEQLLICMGRFVTFKGHRYLLDALARLPAELNGRRWRLLMLGDGPLGEALHEQAQALGINERILWLGWRPEPAPYLQLADLVVFPSLDAEPMGNVLLEAWAWRLPLVTASFRGAREIVRHGEDAWCVPCADGPALALGIQQVLDDPALAKALVERGAERAEQEFSRAAIMQRYWELYTDLADG